MSERSLCGIRSSQIVEIDLSKLNRNCFLGFLFLISTMPALAFDSPAKVAFAKLKALVGNWKGQAGKQLDGMEANVTYKLIAGGNVLVETYWSGSPNETMNVYHLDKGDLVVTSFNTAGNEPRLKFSKGANENVIKFDFVSGSNMAPTDLHIHSITFNFDSSDHIIVDMQSFDQSKPSMIGHFDLVRVKK